MRPKEKETLCIKYIAKRYFGDDAKIYLFGSRLCDDKKGGGDIDLYIETGQSLYFRLKIKDVTSPL